MEKELTAAVTTQEPMLADSLIVVQQLPVIKEQLHSIKAQAQASVAEALALVCTEETLKVVKEQRAKLNRDRKDLDDRRAVVKKQIMKPFEDFDKVYKECVTDVYGPADEALKGKITDVEAGLKADKEKKVVAYFDELVKANGVEWVSYEDIGIAVTMTASLKSLKGKVKEYVDRVVADVNCISFSMNINLTGTPPTEEEMRAPATIKPENATPNIPKPQEPAKEKPDQKKPKPEKKPAKKKEKQSEDSMQLSLEGWF